MNKKALFIIPPENFNEVELFHPKSILENSNIAVTIASTKIGEIVGNYQGKIKSEVIFSDVPANNYEIVAVIGGTGTIDHLWGNEELIKYLKQAYDQKVLVTGICAGSVSIVETGLLSGRKATCYPINEMINKLKVNNVEYIVQPVVIHEDIITSDGPDGAGEFGRSLVEAITNS
ncbi:TPA: DJ-1/PfpI family protein [Bacillus pseudomycoides]|nr:DJ-1/PfpI family protein [Bacillus pseudomycoides]